jgi:subtilase family serine protease
VHPLAQARYDRGAVPDSFPADRVLLLLGRPADRETALQEFLGDVHRLGSASYHQWLTPLEYGRQFGPADSDIQTAESWLRTQGFNVARVTKSKQFIEFSGTAGQLRNAFHTEIHQYDVEGETHYANASEISIPAALAPLVRGLSPLNNFRAKPQLQVLGPAAYSRAKNKTTPQWTIPNGNMNFYAVAPEDFATQYDLTPLYQAGVNGMGQTIGIINESNIDISLVNAYQQLFSLSSNPTQVVIDGDDPGSNEADIEAYLDVEVSGAVAPKATVNLYISNGSDFEDPVALSAIRAIEDNQASVLSVSFGECEHYLENAGNQFWSGLWEQAAAQGQTVFVSAGDSGSAGCDPGWVFPAMEGLAVNGLASTPWNVAVGGTDFYYSDYASGAPSAATLWNQTNDSNLGSLKAPLPEQPWNDYLGLNAVNLYPGNNGDIAAGGGASACVVQTSPSETCTSGYAKPAWQTGPGVPADGVRDLPDVSLFASNGANLSATPICAFEGECAPGTNSETEILLVGGTSASSPAMAGIMALINQKYGRQGQANFTLYPLAQQKPSAFHDITLGSNNVNCLQGSLDCSLDSNGDGLYTLQEYPAGAGYDLASGIGSVDANVLVSNWNSITFLPTTTTLGLSSTKITHGTPITVTASVAPASGSGTPTGGVAILTNSTLPTAQSQTVVTLSGGTASDSINFFPGGYYDVSASYHGDGVFGSSTSSPIALTVIPENSNINFSVINDQTQTALSNGGTIAYNMPLSLSVQPTGVSAPAGKTNGNATGTAAFTVDSITATVPLSGVGVASWTPPALAIGNHTASATYSGDASFNASSATPVTFSVTKGYPSITGYEDASNVNVGGSLTVAIVVSPYAGFTAALGTAAPTGTVTVCLGGGQVCSNPNYSQTATLASPSGNNALDSSATVTFTNLAAGEYIVTALYNGDANWLTQAYLNNNIIDVFSIPPLADSTTALSITPASISGSELATFIITVTGTGNSGIAPTGLVVCYTNGIPIVSDGLSPANTGATSSASFQIGSGWFWNNGANPLTAIYYGDNNYQPSTSNVANLTVTQSGGDFTLTPQLPQITVQSGSSGTVGLNLTSLSNFNGVVTMTCAPSSSNVTCGVNPSTPTLNGTATATLTINAPAQAAGLRVHPYPGSRLGWLGAGSGFMLASVLVGGFGNRKRRLAMLLSLGLFAALFAVAGCGSGGGQNVQPPPANAATYSVVVSATANGIIHNAKITVVVP